MPQPSVTGVYDEVANRPCLGVDQQSLEVTNVAVGVASHRRCSYLLPLFTPDTSPFRSATNNRVTTMATPIQPNPTRPAFDAARDPGTDANHVAEPRDDVLSPRVDEAASYVESRQVSAVYPSRAEAEGIRLHLIEQGFAADDLEILQGPAEVVVMQTPAADSSDDVLKEMLVDATIGTAVGTGLGAIGTGVIWAWGVTLFVASPVVAPLAMIGWFASIGGLVGAAAGAMRHGSGLTELVNDAVKAGNSLLVAHTHNPDDTALAMAIIGPSLRGRDETVTNAL